MAFRGYGGRFEQLFSDKKSGYFVAIPTIVVDANTLSLVDGSWQNADGRPFNGDGYLAWFRVEALDCGLTVLSIVAYCCCGSRLEIVS